MKNKLMQKLSLLFLTIIVLQVNDMSAFNYIKECNSNILIGTTLLLASSVIAVKIYDKKLKNKQQLEEFNKSLKTDFKINQETIFAFDLHDVIAEYDIKKMIRTGLCNPQGLMIIFYPKTFPAMVKSIKKSASSQEVLENIAQQYPDSARLKQIYNIGIDIACQLKGMQGTIDIAQKLMAKEHKVIFVSNIEPKLWQRFLIDFPMFKDCDKFIVGPENGWIKKPSEQYFKNFLQWAKEKNFESRNILFIDDRLKNVVAARSLNIPSYGFISPEDLKQDLEKMGSGLK